MTDCGLGGRETVARIEGRVHQKALGKIEINTHTHTGPTRRLRTQGRLEPGGIQRGREGVRGGAKERRLSHPQPIP